MLVIQRRGNSELHQVRAARHQTNQTHRQQHHLHLPNVRRHNPNTTRRRQTPLQRQEETMITLVCACGAPSLRWPDAADNCAFMDCGYPWCSNCELHHREGFQSCERTR